MTLIDFFDCGLELGNDHTCLTEGNISLTYGQVADWTHRIAWSLSEAGINRQSCVATLAPNNLWAYVSMLGLQRAGCVWIPLNARSSPSDNIAHLKRTECRWLFYHSDFESHLEEIFSAVPTLKGAVCVDQPKGWSGGLDGWSDNMPGEPFPPPGHDPRHDVFRITTSGGTTGTPKAVVHTQVNCETNVASFLALFKYTERPQYLLCIPMTHAAGSVSFHVLALGGTVHILAKTDLDQIIDTIEERNISTLTLTPTSVYSILARPDIKIRDFSSLKYLCIGAAPLSVDKLHEAMDVFGPVVTHMYGQTEASTLLTCMLPEEYIKIAADPTLAHRLQSCGRTTPFTRIAIMDENGNFMPAGERGELVVRSGMVMRGYLDDPASEAEASKFGWHHTGDIAYRDADGYIYIVDRIRDLIITGGFNVFPIDIEQVIWAHPSVQDCAVVGVPDEKWGEAVKAVIELKPGASATEEEIMDMCRAQLGSVKTPKSVDFWPSLPKSPFGKVLKKNIREHYLQTEKA